MLKMILLKHPGDCDRKRQAVSPLRVCKASQSFGESAFLRKLNPIPLIPPDRANQKSVGNQ